jgi:hypothetical protein
MNPVGDFQDGGRQGRPDVTQSDQDGRSNNLDDIAQIKQPSEGILARNRRIILISFLPLISLMSLLIVAYFFF